MKIVKVFTRFDFPPLVFHVPYFDDVTVSPSFLYATNNFDALPLKVRDYKPTKIEYGVEGVRFITYENV